MPKRKIFDDSEQEEEEEEKIVKKPKLSKPVIKIKLENSPPVNNIKELIGVGKTLKFYKNIDVVALWDILPHLEDLDRMIGMESVKETIFYQVIYYLQNMHSRNKNEEYLHTIITGSPGCGKTSLAKIIGKIYTNLGVLSKKNNTFTVAYREDFVGEYLGQTSVKTRKFLEKCLGGVLFIDEVYSMGPGQKDKDSFSKEAIDTLCSFLSEHKNDFCCIVAGYKDEVKNCFMSINSGLDRRFPWRHDIDDYTPENIADIFFKMMNDSKWELCIDVNREYIANIVRNNKELFKNTGGSIETFISKIKMLHAKRVFSLDKSCRFKLNREDIENGIREVNKSIKTKSTVKYDMYT